MKLKTTYDRLYDIGFFKNRDDEFTNLFKNAAAKDELNLIDCMSVRDLLELSCNENDSPLAAVLLSMFISLNRGSICLKLNKTSLVNTFKGFIKSDKSLHYTEKFIARLDAGEYRELISQEISAYLPVIRVKNGKYDLLYFKKYHEYETGLKDGILRLLNLKLLENKASQVKLQDKIIDEVVLGKPMFMDNGLPMKLDKMQELAVRLSLKSNFLIISGGPGTGKTSILFTIIRSLVRKGVKCERIFISAPTGKAAQRIIDSVLKSLTMIKAPTNDDKLIKNVSVSTIHRMLKYNPSKKNFLYKDNYLLPADVIIVDEVSMVDLFLMNSLFKAINLDTTKVILVGDRAQLPSVNAGSVLIDLIPKRKNLGKMKDRVVFLKNDYRSKGKLRSLALEINRDKMTDSIKWQSPVLIHNALKISSGEYAIIKPSGRVGWVKILKQWSEHFYLRPDDIGESYIRLVKRVSQINFDLLYSNDDSCISMLDRLFERLQRAKILTVIRDGLFGCTGINKILSEILNPLFDNNGTDLIFNGAPVLITKNDYSKELFNGDIGVMFRDMKGVSRLVVKKTDKYLTYLLDSVSSYELGFAMTIHKSQGSEFDNILIVLPEKGGDALLTREIIYTGFTRARERVIVYGKESVLNCAIKRSIDRVSGFSI